MSPLPVREEQTRACAVPANKGAAIRSPDERPAGAHHHRVAATVQMSPPETNAISEPSGEIAGSVNMAAHSELIAPGYASEHRPK